MHREAALATNEESAADLCGLARGSVPTKSHKNAPGRHRFSQDNQPPKAKVGRPKGARNKLTKSITELLLRAAAEVGDSTEVKRDGAGGVLGYFKVSAVLERRAFLALLGRALPLQVQANVAHNPILTREEAIAELKLHGLPAELIDQLRPIEYVLDGPDPYGGDDLEPAK
jgi:hypothetical protein